VLEGDPEEANCKPKVEKSGGFNSLTPASNLREILGNLQGKKIVYKLMKQDWNIDRPG